MNLTGLSCQFQSVPATATTTLLKANLPRSEQDIHLSVDDDTSPHAPSSNLSILHLLPLLSILLILLLLLTPTTLRSTGITARNPRHVGTGSTTGNTRSPVIAACRAKLLVVGDDSVAAHEAGGALALAIVESDVHCGGRWLDREMMKLYVWKSVVDGRVCIDGFVKCFSRS